MQMLVATDFSSRSQRAVRRAGLLARAAQARLCLLHVVDDDQPQKLVEIERRETERILQEQIQAVAELRGVECLPVVAAGDPFDGISRKAVEIGADLIVMGTHRRQLLRDIFVGTTVERVIRTGRRPVLMVNTEVARPYTNVLAPVDMSEASANAVRVAIRSGLLREARVTLLHAFLAFAKGQMQMASLERSTIDDYVKAERQKARDELASLAAQTGLVGPLPSILVEEGDAFDQISHAVASINPDLVVMGTHGRSGLMKVLLGSVTEDALRNLNVDILVVPPEGRDTRMAAERS
jgi:nucleotide-binding universal stress UspA family protein